MIINGVAATPAYVNMLYPKPAVTYSTNARDAKKGDKISVVLDGEVTYADKYQVAVKVAGTVVYLEQDALAKAYVVVSKIPKVRPKVGEKMSGQDMADFKWNVGTLVKTGQSVFAFNALGKWTSLKSGDQFVAAEFHGADYTLLHDAK